MKKLYGRLIQSVSAHVRNQRPPLRQAQEILAWEDSQSEIYRISGPHTRIFDSVEAIRTAALHAAPAEGLLLEFGVYKGNSITEFSRMLDTKGDSRAIYGFDSFKGFSEIWGGMSKKWAPETFDLEGELPSVPGRIELVKGYVEETFPEFLAASKGQKIAFIHIDTDTYSPARAILSLAREHLKKGSVILFDQLMGYPNWRQHEYRALTESLDCSEYEVIGFAAGNDGKALIRAALQIC